MGISPISHATGFAKQTPAKPKTGASAIDVPARPIISVKPDTSGIVARDID